MADRPNRSPPGVPPPPFRGEHHTHDAHSGPPTYLFPGDTLLCFSPEQFGLPPLG